MRSSEFRLILHNHAEAHIDGEGKLWLPSTMGRWVDALALHFKEIILLTHQTPTRLLPRQDECVERKNVRLISMGPPGRMWDRIPRMGRIRKACRVAASLGDGLLIRGVTPRQYTVWRETSVRRKAFLLVGEPNIQNPRRWYSAEDLWSAFMSRHRLRELRSIFTDSVVAVNSPGLVDAVRQRFGMEAEFIPTCTVRRNEFLPTENGTTRPMDDPIRLFFCGRLTPSKGIPELLRALMILQKLGRRCTLDIVGAPSEGVNMEQLKREAAGLGVAEHIQWHGQLPYGDRLLEFYRQSDIFVLPSYSEGFPHVLWEAGASRCAVITCAVGGIPGLWEHGKHGLLIRPRDVDALAVAIKRLIDEEGLRCTLVSNAYEHAWNHSVEACAERLVDLLQKKWNEHSTSSPRQQEVLAANMRFSSVSTRH